MAHQNHINKNNASILMFSFFNFRFYLRSKPTFFLQNKQFLLMNDVTSSNVTLTLLIYYC